MPNNKRVIARPKGPAISSEDGTDETSNAEDRTVLFLGEWDGRFICSLNK